MSIKEYEFTGWWNNNKENPEIKFKPPEETDKWKLVRIKITLPLENKYNKKLDKKLDKSTKHMERSIKKLIKDSKHWGKLK